MTSYVSAITGAFVDEMRWISSLRVNKHNDGVVIAFPLWGEPYIESFDKYFVASALCGANMKCLRHRVTLLIYAPLRHLSFLQDYSRELIRRGVDPLIRILPDQIFDEASRSQNARYPLLGVVQQLGVQLAGRIGAGYHSGNPDHLYSVDYFRNLDKLSRGIDAIVQNTLSVSAGAADLVLDKVRSPDGSLALTPLQVGDLCLTCTHPQMSCGLMNGRADYPGHHYMFWRGRDFAQVAYINGNISWMSWETCVTSRVSLWSTLDAQVPTFVGNRRVRIPSDTDGMMYTEISGSNKEAITRRLSLEEFVDLTWEVVQHDERYLPWLSVPYRIPASITENFMPEDDIILRHEMLVDAVREGRASSLARSKSMTKEQAFRSIVPVLT